MADNKTLIRMKSGSTVGFCRENVISGTDEANCLEAQFWQHWIPGFVDAFDLRRGHSEVLGHRFAEAGDEPVGVGVPPRD